MRATTKRVRAGSEFARTWLATQRRAVDPFATIVSGRCAPRQEIHPNVGHLADVAAIVAAAATALPEPA